MLIKPATTAAFQLTIKLEKYCDVVNQNKLFKEKKISSTHKA